MLVYAFSEIMIEFDVSTLFYSIKNNTKTLHQSKRKFNDYNPCFNYWRYRHDTTKYYYREINDIFASFFCPFPQISFTIIIEIQQLLFFSNTGIKVSTRIE